MHGTLPETKTEAAYHPQVIASLEPKYIQALECIAEDFERGEDPLENTKFDMVIVYAQYTCNTAACICGHMIVIADGSRDSTDIVNTFRSVLGWKGGLDQWFVIGNSAYNQALGKLFMPWDFIKWSPNRFDPRWNNKKVAAHAIRTYLKNNDPEWILEY